MESVFEVIAEPNRRAILSLLVASQQSVGRSSANLACRSRPCPSTCECYERLVSWSRRWTHSVVSTD